MKRFLLLFATLCLSAAMIGCNEPPTGPADPGAGTITFEREILEVDGKPALYRVEFTKDEYLWNLDFHCSENWCNCRWIGCSDTSGDLELEISANDTGATRQAVATLYIDDYNISAKLTIIQQPLNVGEIFSVNGAYGVVFYAQKGTIKLVSVEEGSTNTEWSTESVATGATDSNEGIQNFVKIQTTSSWEKKYPAFKWCQNYGESWYLPAINELQEIYKHKDVINASLSANGYAPITDSYHWSSTEYNSGEAYRLNFSRGSNYQYNKTKSSAVRAITSF